MEQHVSAIPREEGSAPQAQEKKTLKKSLSEYFTATRVAYIGIFTAISFVLRLLEFSVLPTVPYLQLDFSNVFPLIGGYALGPVAGMSIGIIKELLCIFFSKTAGVGELANIIVMTPFVLIPSIAYKYRKGIKSVILFLAAGCIGQVLWSFPVNWLLNFPVFVGFNWPLGMAMFIEVWYWAVLFNLIKVVALSVVVLLLYKSVSRLIKFTNSKFTKKRQPRTK